MTINWGALALVAVATVVAAVSIVGLFSLCRRPIRGLGPLIPSPTHCAW